MLLMVLPLEKYGDAWDSGLPFTKPVEGAMVNRFDCHGFKVQINVQ